MTTLMKENIELDVGCSFRGSVHCHHDDGGVQADMVLEEELIHRQQESGYHTRHSLSI